MSDRTIDGSVQYGSRKITIVGRGTYKTEDFSFETGSETVTRTNENNKPDGHVHNKGDTTGSATLMLDDANHAIPQQGDQFTETDISVNAFTLTSVGSVQGKGAERKIQIQFMLNATTDITTETDS